MQMQKFEADSMPEALEKVRALLGEEAMIVKSRKVSKGGLFGTARRESVEVSAALDNFNDSKGPAEAGADRWEGTAGLPSPALQNQLDSLNVKLDTLLLGLGAGTIDRPATEGSLSAANSEEAIKGLARQLPYCGGITLSDKPTIVALVGATGAGKTTSLLKLAGQYSLLHKKKVSLITADTIRLGAVEQLKAFCRVLGLNLRVVLSPEEMAAAVAEMGGQDLVLVDTPGGSQRDQLHNSQVKAFLQAAQPAETHLV
jgi:flagellar biosynthesis protein FlhF